MDTAKKTLLSPGDGLTILGLTLLGFGLVMVYSSSSIFMELNSADATLYLRRQLLWAVLAACAFLIVRSTDMALWRRWALPIYGAALFLCLIVLVPGVSREISGARRWLTVAGLNFQPSELAKVGVILLMARLLSEHRDRLSDLRHGFLPLLTPILVACGLVAIEPDFGSAGLIGLVGLSMLFIAGARWGHLALLSGPAVLGLLGLIMIKGAHVRQRFAAFFDPESDPVGASYQVRQAIIAIGSGGLWGQGLGASRQKRLFLPDVHTDFIFALVGEELGLIGAGAIVLLFGVLIALCFRAVFRARDDFSFLTGFGLALTLGVQSVINMAVATGSVPPKGIALPFISAGGSSLLISAAALGMLVRIAARGIDREKLAAADTASPAPSQPEEAAEGGAPEPSESKERLPEATPLTL